MLAIQPGSDNSGDEELGTVGVGTSVGHGKETRSVVDSLEVLVSKLLAVDGLAAGTIVSGKVTTLQHELGNDTVEGGAGVAKALLASAESSEVLGSLGDNVVVELERDTAKRLAVSRDVKENLVAHCN